MRPEFYSNCPRERVFLGSPSGHVVDLVLFLAALHAPHAVFVLVPRAYHVHAPIARLAALSRLHGADRMCMVPCTPCPPSHLVQAEWICVFKDAAVKREMLKRTAQLTEFTPPPTT